MALSSWVTVAPKTGKGNATVTFSAPAYADRDDRITNATIKCVNNPSLFRTVKITQTGKDVLTMDTDKGNCPSVGTIVISGTSNSQALIYRLLMSGLETPKNPPIGVGVTWEVNINGSAVASGANVPNDPGAYGMYPFEIRIVCTGNTTNQLIPFEFRMTTKKGVTETCVFKWMPGNGSSGNETLTIDTDNIIISNGNEPKVQITSSSDWVIE